MKELIKKDTVYLPEFDVNVNTILTTAQIQQIANAVHTTDNWAEREINKIMNTLFHATDIGEDTLQSYDFDVIEQSGLAQAVIKEVTNYNKIDEAVGYVESTNRAVNQIVATLKPMIDQIGEATKRGRKSSKK